MPIKQAGVGIIFTKNCCGTTDEYNLFALMRKKLAHDESFRLRRKQRCAQRLPTTYYSTTNNLPPTTLLRGFEPRPQPHSAMH